ACFALALSPLVGVAQIAPATKDPLVRSIRIKTDGTAVSEQFVLGFVALRQGEPFSKDAVASTVRSLYATGRFNQALVEPILDPVTGQVDIVVTVEPRPILKEIEYIGGDGLVGKAGWFGGSVIEDVKVGEPLDMALLRRSELKLQNELRKKRPFARVTSQLRDTVGGKIVAVIVDEGIELKVDNFRFEGATSFDRYDLWSAADLKTSEYRWYKWSWLIGGGRLDPEQYRADCKKLREYYRSKGYLDVEVEDADPEKVCEVKDVKDASGWVDVVFKIKEGRKYTVGAIAFEGNRLGASDPVYSNDSLRKVVSEPSLRRGAHPAEFDKIASGEAFAIPAIEAAADKLREYYGQMGYINSAVQGVRKPDLATGAIDVKFQIEEGQRHTVRAVEIQGNSKTRSTAIARELALGPGEVFDLARTRVSEARLRNTQFFEEVRVAPVPTSIPGQSDLRVTVKEGPTGQVSFGAGYSTVEGLVGFVEYAESNFDFANSEGWYRGDGQKFRVRVSVGSLTSSLEHSFEEPALWERDLAVGYSIERRYAGYASANYSVLSEGISLYARRRVFSNIEGRIGYNLRRMSVGNVTAEAPADVVTEGNAGARVISSVSASLTYDTRDEYNFPTKGSRISLTEELAGNGLGGEVKYLKSELRTGRWFLVSPTAEQTVGVVGRVGLLTGTGGYLPFYERFYLGGAYDMRGFGYNEVGAYDTYDTSHGNQPMGGMTYGFLSAEYTIKAADNLRFAAFYDYGIVNRSETDFSVASANSDVGLGMRILLGGAVMRLDFGFPLQTTKAPVTGVPLNTGGMKFNFSFGTVF
ncbi:MAG: outer membrane protein assembly factor BamA, partial [Opitutales bacterium]|nr:outer membrane protein assembly factor BamA [Opitutales bacterium]